MSPSRIQTRSPNRSKRPAIIRDAHRRLAKIRVLVADHDRRTASLVHSVLISFGFETIHDAHDGESAIKILEEHDIDLLITEWDLRILSGIRLVKAIRHTRSGKRWARDLPAIMLTAKADLEAVREARDAGFTEFVAKPFSARSLSTRLLSMIDNPRAFVISEEYVGPCRRRRNMPPPGGRERRRVYEATQKDELTLSEILPPNQRLRQLIGEDLKGTDIFTDNLINSVQRDLMRKEAQFIEWARDDIRILEVTYKAMEENHGDAEARQKFTEAAYTIKSQAGMFGYDMGTEVTRMLLDYFHENRVVDANCLVILRMHVDTIRVVFQHKIKDSGRAVAVELVRSLQKLIQKLST